MSHDPDEFDDLSLDDGWNDETDEDDLWFLPDRDDERDINEAPCFGPVPQPTYGAFIELEAWRDARAGLAVQLAEISGELGALAQMLSTGPCRLAYFA